MTYRNVNGFVFPDTDVDCAPAMFATIGDLEKYYPFVKKFDVAVQAGGNVGIFPAKLAERFGMVYTFEPDADNFNCLAHNAMLSNVIKFQCALGDRHEGIKLWVNPSNVGAHYVDGTGEIPTLMIDDLNLQTLDFLMLDVEGYEHKALLGGRYTINEHHPVVVLEEKGHGKRYGDGDAGKWLIGIGYKEVARVHRDVVYKWQR